jgi:molecular chaperone GrpE
VAKHEATTHKQKDPRPTEERPQLEADEAAAAQPPATEDEQILGLYEQIQRAHDERDQLRDQLLRTMADFQNFRKRAEQDKQQIRQYATENLVADLLPVLDNFERTIAAFESGASAESLIEGVKAVDRQLRTVLESQRVTRIQSHGQPFDPDLHEALGSVESDEHPENTVVAEVQPGYRMGDKVIRPARVRVAKKK